MSNNRDAISGRGRVEAQQIRTLPGREMLRWSEESEFPAGSPLTLPAMSTGGVELLVEGSDNLAVIGIDLPVSGLSKRKTGGHSHERHGRGEFRLGG